MALTAFARQSAPGTGTAVAGATLAIFLSSNLVNLGNLGFNVLFSHWMGPALFGQLATLLTLFLAVMGVVGAVQMAVSKRVAEADAATAEFAVELNRLSRRSLVVGFAVLPVLVATVLALNLGQRMGLGPGALLPLLLLCLPFALPLSLARGLATGRLDAQSVILSAQIEVWVRLLGAVGAWMAGLGLEGVTLAIVVSVVAGWLPLRRLPTQGGYVPVNPAASLGGLVFVALPFAVLQASQTLLLDGDVLLAQAVLGPEEAGHVAALTLFQRIQFYGCFSLASVLLPAVTAEVVAGRSPIRAAGPVFALYLAVSFVVVFGASLMPGLVMQVLVGAAFLPAADALPAIALAAALFTLSYLLATYLAATGDRAGIWAMAVACPLQLSAISALAQDLSTLVTVKLVCQLALAAWLLCRVLGPILLQGRPHSERLSH